MDNPTLRNLVSRGTALALGTALASVSARCGLTIWRIVHESDSASTPGESGVRYLLIIAAIAAVPATVLIGFALLPTRTLYAIDPTPSAVDGDDVAEAIGRGL